MLSQNKTCVNMYLLSVVKKIDVQSFQMSLFLQFKLQYSDYTFNTRFTQQNTGEAQRIQQACSNIHELRYSVTFRQ